MKISTLTFTVFVFFSFYIQAQSKKTIYVNIENIPKIQLKVQEKNGFSREDKSPTITYRYLNDWNIKTLEYNSISKSVFKDFDQDYIFLKLRYNPGKYQQYVLQRGDSAFIEYSDGKPYLEVTNRKLKKHDAHIYTLLDNFDVPNFAQLIFSENGELLSDEERNKMEQKLLNAYDSQLNYLDSLYSNKHLSKAEYIFNRSSIYYKKASRSKKYATDILTLEDLHIESYRNLLSMHIRRRLKKPTISIGNGMTVNWLEGFDQTKNTNVFSTNNKHYLLEYYLNQMKTDFPVAKYRERRKVFEEITAKKIASSDDDLLNMIDSLHTFANTVELTDASGIPTSLQTLLELHKGKVIYIDFWASWCAPCRAAFPAYPDLEKQYKEKEVVFLFISTDKDGDRWQKANEKEKLTHSYRAINYPEAQLYQKLNLSRIPRYLIFGKDGKLAHHKAPGPSSDAIQEFIDQTLKE